MENRTFDELARTTAQGGTRRGLLRALSGSVLGAGLAWLGIEEAAAACKPPGKKCDKNKDCCAKKCRGNKTRTCRCLKHGAVCAGLGGSECCSGVCLLEIAGESVTCCVSHNDKCNKDSDCCRSLGKQASACQDGRCCRKLGEQCANPNGVQFSECCSGAVGPVFCDRLDSLECRQLPIHP